MASTIRQRRFNRPIIKGLIVKVMPSLAEKLKAERKRDALPAAERRNLKAE